MNETEVLRPLRRVKWSGPLGYTLFDLRVYAGVVWSPTPNMTGRNQVPSFPKNLLVTGPRKFTNKCRVIDELPFQPHPLYNCLLVSLYF